MDLFSDILREYSQRGFQQMIGYMSGELKAEVWLQTQAWKSPRRVRSLNPCVPKQMVQKEERWEPRPEPSRHGMGSENEPLWSLGRGWRSRNRI